VKRINENIAYSKSILNKSGITPDSEEYQDYLTIRKICGSNNGYVGILTKIRFVDGVTDMDEIESIFNVLKNSKIDINKLNKMSYNQILDIFYDEFSDKGDNTDLELVYKDSQYSYYRVYTYKGILKIASPAWCLKTKSHWDNYHSKYPHQWVVIDNRYVKNIITPENNYLQNYNSTKGWIRYGISLNPTDWSYVAFTDNNNGVRHSNSSYTFYGVLFTILNLEMGHMYSYWHELPGCEHLSGTKTWQKVVDQKVFCHNMNLPEDYLDDNEEIYIVCSETYSSRIGIILFNNSLPKVLYPVESTKVRDLTFSNLAGSISKSLIENYALRSNDTLYYGIKLIKGQITMDDFEFDKRFISKVGKWLIFNRNSDYYQVINTEMNSYEIPTYCLNASAFNMGNPMYFYVHKHNFEVYNTQPSDYNEYATDVIQFLKQRTIEEYKKTTKETDTKKAEPEKEKKVRGFWDFLKRKK